MSSSTTTTTTVSGPSRAGISFGSRARLAIVGVIGAGILASGVVLASDGGEQGTAAAPAAVQESQPTSPAFLDLYRRRGIELSQSTWSGVERIDPHPAIDQRQAAERFNHR